MQKKTIKKYIHKKKNNTDIHGVYKTFGREKSNLHRVMSSKNVKKKNRADVGVD